MDKEIVASVNIKDDIGNEFRADITLEIEELQEILSKHNMKIVPIK